MMSKKMLGIIVPIFERGQVDLIIQWVKSINSQIGEEIDLIFYDSADDDLSNQRRQYLLGVNNPNIIYNRFFDESQSNGIDYKIKTIMQKENQKYDYIWIVRDRDVPRIDCINKQILVAIKTNPDFIIVDPYRPLTNKHRTINDCRDVFKLYNGKMTLLGSIIFSSDYVKQLSDYEIDNSNEGWFIPTVLYQVISEKEFRADYYNDDFFEQIDVQNSFWMKDSLIWHFVYRW